MDSKQEAALRAHLVDTIVNPEVIAPMDAVNWSNAAYEQSRIAGPPSDTTAPTPPDAALPSAGTAPDNPASTSEPGAQAQPSSLDFEQFKDPSNGLYAGKYTSPEELIKGMKNVVNMAKQAFTERDELRAKLASVPTHPAPEIAAYSPPAATTGPETLDKVLDQIVADGGILDESNSKLLRDAVIELTETKAKNVVSATTRETQVWDDVSRRMEERYPGSTNRVDELHMFVQSDPAVSTAVAALLAQNKEFEATDMAWRLMTNASPVTSPALTPAQVKEVTMQAQDSVRQEAVDAARKDAGVLTTSGGGVHESTQQSVSADDIAAAAALGHKTADWSLWRRTALGQFVDFNSPMFRD